MEFTELTLSEFNEFRNQYPKQNFWQSASMCDFKKEQSSGWDSVFVGVKENGKVIACAALFYMNMFMKYRYYTCLRGFMIDYENLSLVEYFLTSLKQYLHTHNALYFKVDPYYSYQSRNKDGECTKEYKHDALLEVFKKCGFDHLGFRDYYDPRFEPRYISIIDLKEQDEAKLLKEMSTMTRRNISSIKKNGIKFRVLAENEYSILADMINATGERKSFGSQDLRYYHNFKKHFKDDMKALYAYIDSDEYLNKCIKEKEQLQEELTQLATLEETKKVVQRKKEKTNLLEVATTKYEEALQLKETYGKEVGLAVAMFVLTDYEILYLFGGSDSALKKYKGPYCLQWHMICESLKRKVERYNFYGISGNFSTDASDYGVYLFKKGFNADVVELVGDFEYIDRKFIYSIYQTLRTIKNKILRRG